MNDDVSEKNDSESLEVIWSTEALDHDVNDLSLITDIEEIVLMTVRLQNGSTFRPTQDGI